MNLKDVIFQGVWGHDKAIRLTIDNGVETIETPPDVEAEQVVEVLVALLYPDSDDGRTPSWLAQAGGDARLGLIVTHHATTYRLLRAGSPESLRLQKKRDETYELAAKGLEAVTRSLDHDLSRPSLGEFLALNCWSFDLAARQLTMQVSESHQFSRQERRTLEAYRRSKRANELEDELEQLEGERDEIREEWGEVLEREERLEEAKRERRSLASDRLDEEQLDLLRHKDRRIERLERKLDELEQREESTRKAVEQTNPTPPWREPWFWGGIVGALAAVGIGIRLEESHRWIMLLDAVGLGVALFIGLRYLTRLERKGVHQVRLESTRRQTREARQELVDLQERLDHILTHASVDSEEALLEKNERAAALDQRIDQFEAELEDVREQSAFQQAVQRLRSLDNEIEARSSELEDLRGATPPMFELENQLHDMGINPKAGLERLEAHRLSSGGPDTQHCDVLRRTCETLGLAEEGELKAGRLVAMWQKICGHVLGSPFDTVIMIDGELAFEQEGERRFEEAAPRGSVERREVLSGLAFAAHASTAARDGRISTMWIAHPALQFSPDATERGWLDVLSQAEGSFEVALLR